MPISSRQLHYDVRRKINRINSEAGRYISVPELDAYLTEAYRIYFENRVAIVETNPLVRNDLRPFEMKKVKLSLSEKDSTCVVAAYPSDFYQKLRVSALATSECTEPEELIVRAISSDDISEAFASPMWWPSWAWRETFADEAYDGLYVYQKDFKVQSVFLDYIRAPKKIAAPSLLESGSYVDADGNTVSQDIPMEMDTTFAHRKVTDIAVLMIKRDLSDFPEYEAQLSKIMQVEKIHIA
jgi:hypothetical protein